MCYRAVCTSLQQLFLSLPYDVVERIAYLNFHDEIKEIAEGTKELQQNNVTKKKCLTETYVGWNEYNYRYCQIQIKRSFPAAPCYQCTVDFTIDDQSTHTVLCGFCTSSVMAPDCTVWQTDGKNKQDLYQVGWRVMYTMARTNGVYQLPEGQYAIANGILTYAVVDLPPWENVRPRYFT